jgi:predicted glycosyltransferase involved in capsule biosynthesis
MLGEYDIIYPYGNGQYQKRINKTYNRDKFYELYDINIIDDYDIWSAVCGHCFFIKTDSYKKIGGENEKFIAYGPEDVERYERFEKLNLNLGRIDNYVYHFEHDRMEFSNYMNPNFTDNERLLSYIRSLNNEDLINYYENLDYIKKYNFI